LAAAPACAPSSRLTSRLIEIIAAGTPEDVAKIARCYTGQYLKQMLKKQLGATAAE
jgi:hypothetical protein